MPRLDLGNVMGEPGLDGVGIKSFTFKQTTAEGNVYDVIGTNDKVIGTITAPKGAKGDSIKGDTGSVGPIGPQGIQGIGIKNLTLKESTSAGNTYTVNLTNGTTGGEVVAPKGAVGPQGAVGAVGPQGTQGVGIKSIKYKSTASDGSFIYTITLTNGVTEDVTCPIGPKGDKGDSIKGDKGEPGVSPVIINNLTTNDSAKALSAAMGKKLYDDSWRIVAKVIGNTSTNTDLNTILEDGFYRSEQESNKFTNLPLEVETNGAFVLQVISIRNNNSYKIQILIPYNIPTPIIRTLHGGTWSHWERVIINREISSIIDDLQASINSKVDSVGAVVRGSILVEGTGVIRMSLQTDGLLMANNGIDVKGTSTLTGNVTANGDLTGTSAKSVKGFGKVYNPVWG